MDTLEKASLRTRWSLSGILEPHTGRRSLIQAVFWFRDSCTAAASSAAGFPQQHIQFQRTFGHLMLQVISLHHRKWQPGTSSSRRSHGSSHPGNIDDSKQAPPMTSPIHRDFSLSKNNSDGGLGRGQFQDPGITDNSERVSSTSLLPRFESFNSCPDIQYLAKGWAPAVGGQVSMAVVATSSADQI